MESSQLRIPMLRSFSAITTCYGPDEIEVAEGQLSFTPVRPCEIVQRLTTLTLNQIVLLTRRGLDPGGSPERIAYIFGHIPGDSGGIPDPSPSEPKFVVVMEQPGTWFAEPVLDRTVYHSGEPGAAAKRISYGNWTFHAGRPEGTAHLMVTGNLAGDVIESIGHAMLGVE